MGCKIVWWRKTKTNRNSFQKVWWQFRERVGSASWKIC